MVSKITNSIKISVIPEYDAKNSSPSHDRYVFRYTITITNLSKETIKILKRKWQIYDFSFGYYEVEGNGVIGLTPEIFPGQDFTYFSNVVLKSGIGFMHGKYLVELENSQNFEIEIPRFNLVSKILEN